VTYPNVLVLQYLKKTQQLMPETQMKAENYIGLGYQRLLTFEVPSGGFSLMGNPPAVVGLTAFGLLEISDMAQVYNVDTALIERTATWLREQGPNGTWGNTLDSAFVTWALVEAGQANMPEVQRSLEALRSTWRTIKDPYVLALIANALAATRDSLAPEVLGALDGMKIVDGETVHWGALQPTLMGSYARTGDVETTALVVHAMLRAELYPELVQRGLTYLITQKDAFGTWYSTQATVLSLKALILAAMQPGSSAGEGQVTLSLDGAPSPPVAITAATADMVHSVAFDDVSQGDHTVAFQVQGGGNLMYQVTADYYLPWDQVPADTGAVQEMDIAVDYDRTRLAVNDEITARAQIVLLRSAPARLAIVDLGVPPGFSVETQDLERLVEGKVIQRFEVTGRQIILYVENLTPKNPVQVTYRLRARFPIKAKTPSSAAYDYYNPESTQTVPPVDFVVE
jgi:hypothetical protein